MRLALILIATATATAAAVVTTTSAVAHAGPSVISEAGVVRPGDRYVLHGEGWSVAPGCASRVGISQRESHGFRVGSAPIHEPGTFTFSRRVPRRAAYGTRILLDVTQFCDGIGASRTVKLKVGKASRMCPLVRRWARLPHHGARRPLLHERRASHRSVHRHRYRARRMELRPR